MKKLYTERDAIALPERKEVDPINKVLEEVKEMQLLSEDPFTTKQGKYTFVLDDSELYPSNTTLLGGNFKEKYRRQLAGCLFGKTADDINVDGLLPLLVLVETIDDGKVPIKITSRGLKKFLPLIVDELNKLFKEQIHVLRGIYKMFQETSRSQN